MLLAGMIAVTCCELSLAAIDVVIGVTMAFGIVRSGSMEGSIAVS